jgi:hypothetical protein
MSDRGGRTHVAWGGTSIATDSDTAQWGWRPLGARQAQEEERVGHLRDELACIEAKACKLCLNENGPDQTYEKRRAKLKEG